MDCVQSEDGRVLTKLDSGVSLNVDHLVLATGYRVNVNDVPYLSRASILRRLRVSEGYPVLDEDSQSNIPDLFFTGPAATRDFGPFFRFVVGCPAAAKIMVECIERQIEGAIGLSCRVGRLRHPSHHESWAVLYHPRA